MAPSVNKYRRRAMKWEVKYGKIEGKSGPTNLATAKVAVGIVAAKAELGS